MARRLKRKHPLQRLWLRHAPRLRARLRWPASSKLVALMPGNWRWASTPTLSRYVGLSVVRASAVVLLVLVGIERLSKFVEDLAEDPGEELCCAVPNTLMNTWLDAVEYFPYACLLGALWTFGTSARRNELVAMQGAGLSRLHIFWMGVRLPTVLALLLVLGQQLVPLLAGAWPRAEVAHRYPVVEHRVVWYRDGTDYWHISGIHDSGGQAREVVVWRIDERQSLGKISYARDAYYDRETDRWRAASVKTKLLSGQQVLVQHLPATTGTAGGPGEDTPPATRELTLAIEPKVLRAFIRSERYLPLSDHWLLAGQRASIGAAALRHELLFWRAITSPLMSAALVFVAFSFVVSYGGRRDALAQVFLGVLIGIAFGFVDKLILSSSAVFGWSGYLASAGSIALPVAVGALLLKGPAWFHSARI